LNAIIDWLLSDDTPEVKYRVLTELLGKPRDDASVIAARDALINSQAVSAAMDKFKANKKWEDYNAFSTLAEFGLTRDDVPIDEYVERMINVTKFNVMCGKALLLRNLVALGYYNDSRISGEITNVLTLVRRDGSLRCLSNKKTANDTNLADMCCYRQTTTYLLLAPELKKVGVDVPQAEPLTDFYLKYNVIYRPDDNDAFIINDMAQTFYPFDPVKIGLHMILYGLSVLGAGSSPECERALALLESKKDESGKFILEKSLTKPYFKVGKVGKPNKWITLYALLADKFRGLKSY
jgi:hypothetical protein